MKLHLFFLASLSLIGTSAKETADRSPTPVVRKLYREIVAHKPIGIPKAADKKAIWPFLSKGLIHKLNEAQACEDDYFRQHPGEDSAHSLTDAAVPPTINKPEFDWLELGLFSGGNEEAIPSEAIVVRTEAQWDGPFLVHVRLTYKPTYEIYGRPPDSAHTFQWKVTAAVIFEGGRFVVDDILLFKDNSTEVGWRLSQTFRGAGNRWIGVPANPSKE